MNRRAIFSVFITSLLALAACGDDENENKTSCGQGTILVNNQCVPAEGTNNGDPNNGDPNNGQTNNGAPEVTCGPGTTLVGTECVLSEIPTECGPGTVEMNGQCVAMDPPDPIVCGDGTTEVDGECVLNDDLCGEGEAYQGGQCLALESLCGEGTIYMDGGCQVIDPLADVTQFESEENNDPLFGGVAGELVIGAELKLVQGVIEPASNLDGDEGDVLEPDFDVFLVQGEAGQRLFLQGTAVGAPGIAFAVTYVPAEGQEDPGFVRVGLPFEDGRNAAREVVLPWTGTYEIRIGEARNLTTLYGLTEPVGDWYGGEDFTWIFGAQVLPAEAPFEQVNAGFTFEGDLADVPQVLVNVPGRTILNLGLEISSANANGLLVTSPAMEGSEAPVNQIGGGLVVVPEGGLVITVDHLFNATQDRGFSLLSVPIPNEGLGDVVAGGPTVTLAEPGVLVSNNNQFYNFDVTEPSVLTIAGGPTEGSPANLSMLLADANLNVFAGSQDGLFGVRAVSESFRAFVEPGNYILIVGHEDFIAGDEVFEGTYNFTIDAAPVAPLSALNMEMGESSGSVESLGGLGAEAFMALPVEGVGVLGATAAPGTNLDVQLQAFQGNFLQARNIELATETVDLGGAGSEEAFARNSGPGGYLLRVLNTGAEATEDAGVTVTATLTNEFPVVGDVEPGNNMVGGAGAFGALELSPKFATGALAEDAGTTEDFYTFSVTQTAANVRITSGALGATNPAEYAILEVYAADDLTAPLFVDGDPGFPLFGIPPLFGDLDINLEQGDYVLVASSLTGAQGGYLISAQVVEEFSCLPGGPAVCAGDDVEICDGAGMLAIQTCPGMACVNYGTTADCGAALEMDNNSAETAQPIAEGDLMDGRYAAEGAIEANIDDFYTFTIGANGGVVTLGTLPQFGNDDTVDTVVTVRDADGLQVARNDDNPGAPGLYSLISNLPLDAGTYTVVVEGFGAGEGAYRLFIDVRNFACPISASQCAGDDVQICDGDGFVTVETCDDGCAVDDLSGEARCLTFPAEPLDVPGSADGEFFNTQLLEENFYEIQVTSPIILNIETSLTEGQTDTVDTVMWVCDDSDPFGCSYTAGNLASDDDDGEGTYSLIEYFFREPGTYYVGVRAFSTTATGYYTLTVSEANEPNNTAEEAGMTGVALDIDGDQVIGRLPTGDVDWYVVDVAAFDVPASVLFRTRAVEGLMAPDTRIWLCDVTDPANCTFDAGNLSAANVEGGFEGLEFLFEAEGTFFLVVDAVDSTGFYQLSTGITEEPNNDSDNALELNVPDSVTGRLTNGDVDWFSFEVTGAPQNIIFATNPVEGEMMVDTRLYICDTTDPADCGYVDGNLASNDDDGDLYASLDYTFDTDGVYFVVVEAFDGTGWYTLTLTPTEEPNDSADLAIALPFHTAVPAGLQRDTDLDWFAITIPATSVGVPHEFTTRARNGAEVDTLLYVCDDAMSCAPGANIGENDDDGVSTFSRVEVTFDAEGTYYVVVASVGGSTGDYAVFYTQAATPLTVPGTISGNIEAANSFDRYALQIDAPGMVTLVTSPSDPEDLDDTQIALCALDNPYCIYGFGAANGRLAANDDIGSGNFYSQITYDFTQPGIYVVVVRDFTSATGQYVLDAFVPAP